ncbi:MAG: radical SAM protein [Lachnospiraceae bacterium]|nr:radical SAM protein [Lachnospiraceae bacterium]
MQTKATPYSNIKIFAHTEELKKVRNGERVAPVYVRIKPTNRCNQNCYYCHYKNPYLDLDQYSPQDEIPRQKMLEIISDFAQIGVKAVTFSGGGEPLLYPYIEESFEKVLSVGIDLSVITNGSLLNGRRAELLAKAKWVRISQESGTGETYAKIRGVRQEEFKQLCNNIQNFARIKNPNCELGINYVIGPNNWGEVYQAGKLMKELGVNHVKYTALMSNDVESVHASFKENVIEQIHRLEDEEKVSEFRVINMYESDFDQRAVFGRNYDFCGIKDFVTVIAANSKIYYCHDKAYLSAGEIGDVSEKTFREVWFSQEVTDKFRQFNPQDVCSHHCVYDDRNNLLNLFYGLDENHINFI